ncbi:MAG: PD-(D/E)XK nuclease family protein [Actinomycetota bacterium]|nr:PD-(D/E)XK nuclease family protein [Actinomycetota bacterium]
MIHTVIPVSYGRPATDALANAISEVKSKGGPLAPVTVIVPSNIAGLYARRLLGARRGVANVGFMTPFRFAELLSADVLVDRRPLTNPTLGAAVRVALRDDLHPFGDTADHRATEAAVAALYGTISHLSPTAREAVVGDGWGAQMIALHDRVATLVEEFDDDDDVARAARERADLADALAPFGDLIWYLPEPVTFELGELLSTSFAVASATLIVGLSGDTDADANVVRACQQVGVEVDAAAASPTAKASRLVSVTDADDEVREVISSIWGLAADGVALHRVAIVYPTSTPYLRTLRAQLTGAGMEYSGPSPQRLADTVTGSVLLAALELDESNWRRDRVMALVASGPLRHGEGWARPTAWERCSREAGVVAGRDDWDDKLARLARRFARKADKARAAAEHSERQEDRSAGVVEAGPYVAGRLEADAAEAESLREFVVNLGALLDGVTSAVGWTARATAAAEMVEALLGGANRRTNWPPDQQVAHDRVLDALARLHQLDAIEPTAGKEVFVRAVEAELDAAAPRAGRFGTGVTLVPLAAAAGVDVDAVFVVGMAEGLCPRARSENALLSETIAIAARGEVPTPTERLHAQHRTLLAALSSAPASMRTMSYSRGDLRSSRHHLPSRWLLASAAELTGGDVVSGDLDKVGPDVLTAVASFAARLHSPSEPASESEHDLSVVAASSDPEHHPSVGVAGRAIAARSARQSEAFTEWDGNLAGHLVPSPAGETIPMSPTRLEEWATCGLRYFFHHVLGLTERDDPERIIELGALDKGSALHETLERFVAEALATGEVPAPGAAWSVAQRRRLHEIGTAVFDDLERDGRTGRMLLWSRRRWALHVALDGFLGVDDARRALTGATPAAVEAGFGLDGAAPVSLALDDGRQLLFRGRIDRVDTGTGGRTIVYDYKTGRGTKYDALRKAGADPVQGGAVLQPAIYAEAARRDPGVQQVDAAFWLIEKPAKDAIVSVTLDDAARRRFIDVATAIVDGIEAGSFPAVPGEWNTWRRTHEACTYCDFNTVCPVDRGEQAEAKSEAVEPVRRMLEYTVATPRRREVER